MSNSPSSPVGQPLAATGVAGGSGAMFDGIAARYDLMNRVMTFGIDQRWRRQTVDALQVVAGSRILDLATGTGDMAIMVAERIPNCTVVGLDPSAGMLAVGRDKVAARGLGARIELVHGDACQLPFPDQSFDGITMGYGIRNVFDRPKALAEMARVLKPGARVAILETSEPKGLLGLGAKLHMRVLVPLLGGLLSGAPREYRYLQQSTTAFPNPEDFAKIIESSGLKMQQLITLLAGASCIHVASPMPRLESASAL